MNTAGKADSSVEGVMTNGRPIFVFEPNQGRMQQCAAVIEEAGEKPVCASTPEEATSLLEESSPQLLLMANDPAGIELSHYAREFASCPSPILALCDRREPDLEAVVSQMDADGFLLLPFSASTLRSVLSLSQRLGNVCQQLSSVEKELEEATPKLKRLANTINVRTGFYHFDFIKDLLVVEVRRAKRYGYPLSIILVGLDAIPALHELNRPGLQREITSGLAVAIAKSIRDIDIPIHYADDRILVFLPHTDLAGAEEVGRRVKRRIKRITYRGENVTAQLTASVGVAGINAGENLTFSRLIKDATTALKAAQLKGGDRVMKRISKPGER